MERADAGIVDEDANLNWVYKAYVGGVNQIVWHGFPYLATPDGSGARARWPGNSMGGNADFSESFGPRMPQWPDYRLINDHLARVQLALRQGRPRYDIAVFWHDFGVRGIAPTVTAFTGYPGLSTMLSTTSPLAAAGFTHQYVGPSYFTKRNAREAKHGIWLPERMGFKAILLNDQAVMPLESLRRIRDIALDGVMPLIVVGHVPARTPGLAGALDGDAKLSSTVAELKELARRPDSRIRFVADLAQARAALTELGVRPAATHLSDPASPAILAVRRHSADADYYLLFNQGVTRADQTLTLAGSGIPYELDSWTGKIAPLALYRRNGTALDIPISIGANDIKLVAIGRLPGAPVVPAINVLSTDAAEVKWRGSELILRADKAGSFAALLSDGSARTASAENVPDPTPLDNWTLRIESWTADASGLPGIEHTQRRSLPEITVAADARHRLAGWTALGHGEGRERLLFGCRPFARYVDQGEWRVAGFGHSGRYFSGDHQRQTGAACRLSGSIPNRYRRLPSRRAEQY